MSVKQTVPVASQRLTGSNRRGHRRPGPRAFRWSAGLILGGVAVVVGSGVASAASILGPRAVPAASGTTLTSSQRGTYNCRLNLDTDAFTGADGTASAIGWAGNHQGVVTCLGGTFFVQDGMNRNFGFGIYNGAPTDVDGRRRLSPGPDHQFPERLAPPCPSPSSPTGSSSAAMPMWPSTAGWPFTTPPTDAVVANPAPSPGLVASETGAGHRRPPRIGRPRLRGGGGPLRERLPVADQRGAGRGRKLRPALCPHEGLLEPATGPDRPDHRPRCVPGRRLP